MQELHVKFDSAEEYPRCMVATFSQNHCIGPISEQKLEVKGVDYVDASEEFLIIIWVTNQANQFHKVARRIIRILEQHYSYWGISLVADLSDLPRGNPKRRSYGRSLTAAPAT